MTYNQKLGKDNHFFSSKTQPNSQDNVGEDKQSGSEISILI